MKCCRSRENRGGTTHLQPETVFREIASQARGRVVAERVGDRQRKSQGTKGRIDSAHPKPRVYESRDRRCRTAQPRDVLQDAAVTRPAPALRRSSRPDRKVPVRRTGGSRPNPPAAIVPTSPAYRDRRKRVPVQGNQG